jgi:hypothetical protein
MGKMTLTRASPSFALINPDPRVGANDLMMGMVRFDPSDHRPTPRKRD